MIETKTEWQDSGYDCDHCGGEIAKRIDKETGQPDSVCFQCKKCACQWSIAGDVLRVGHSRQCRTAQRERAGTKPGEFLLSRRVIIILAILALVAVARFGGFGALFALTRLLIPLAAIALVVSLVVRYGREQEWW